MVHQAPCRRPYRSTLLLCRSTVSQPCYAILRHNGHPSATIQCFVSQLHVVRPCARALPHASRVGLPCRRPYRCPTMPCCGLIRPYRGTSPTRPLCAVLPHQALCHDTLHCIVTQHRQTGSSPSNYLLRRFFFSFFFFVPATARPQKNIYIFIYIFSCLQ